MSTLVTLDNISIRLKGKVFLKGISWQIKEGENWAILGPNGSGKSTLAKSLTGALPVVGGKLVHHFAKTEGTIAPSRVGEYFGYVSLELHRDLMERERFNEVCRDFSGKVNEITPVRSILETGMSGGEDENETKEILERIAHRVGIHDLLDRSITRVSTGEMRKVIIARALVKNPKLLILDEPFDGLDQPSHASLAKMINELMADHTQVVLITHRFEEMLDRITHVLFLRNGRVYDSGEKEQIFSQEAAKEVYGFGGEHGALKPIVSRETTTRDGNEEKGTLSAREKALVETRKATVKYGSLIVLHNLDWTVRYGENWAILGPNGSGKSTILKLITGENLQSYANEVFLFGKKRGSGESIWDVKKRIGIFSSELQADYPGKVNAFEIVCSGFFDSMGLYRSCDKWQRQTALKWMKRLGIETLLDETFEMLSFGQRQLVLIARAMVKYPELLILDEPCEGLDIANRWKLLHMIEVIGRETETSLIYVTHHENEIPSCITHLLKFNGEKFVSQQMGEDSTL